MCKLQHKITLHSLRLDREVAGGVKTGRRLPGLLFLVTLPWLSDACRNLVFTQGNNTTSTRALRSPRPAGARLPRPNTVSRSAATP